MSISFITMRSDRYSTVRHHARTEAFKAGQFEWVPGSRCGKIRCTTCTGMGASAYGFLGGSWMDKHLVGHVCCLVCRRVVAVPVFQMHRSNRWHIHPPPEETSCPTPRP